jgi:threonylcarbamoyladenosine tRNA methylthiotransferase MtaB
MNTFSTNTLGCKVNQYESQQIREFLERLGLRQVEWTKKPDLVVVNTCCVTHTAAAKSRQCIRKAQKLNPGATVVVCGCLPTARNGELNDHSGNIIAVRRQEHTAQTLTQIVNGKVPACVLKSLQPCPDTSIGAEDEPKPSCTNDIDALPKLPQLTAFKGQTRAFLKVQDGCDGLCSYCIVPQTRPYVRSKPPEAVLREARALVDAGHKEIVITGIFLGAYGQNSVRRKNWPNGQNDELADLLDKIAKIPNLARIRLSSLEPADVTPRLLDTLCEHRNIMPHLHLSLQSGSDAILKRMCRQYNADDFRRKVQLIKSHLDRPAITTDIIVGFPGETDADFEQTVSLAKEVGFAKMHVFAFSARKGTAAARMKDTVDSKVIKERSIILRDLDIELGREFRRQFIGETTAVLLEDADGQPKGRNERYFVVYLQKTHKKVKRNDLLMVQLLQSNEHGAIGRVEPNGVSSSEHQGITGNRMCEGRSLSW